MESIKILNIEIDNLKMSDILREDFDMKYIIPVNVDVLMKLQDNKDLYDVLQENRDSTCICQDSQIMKLASSIILGSKFVEKISGSDLFPKLCEFYSRNSNKIFLLGAMDGVSKKAMENINNRIGSDVIIDSLSPSYGFEKDQEECKQIIKRINESGATILAVGVGAPKQELWIYKYSKMLPGVKQFIAIGATIDFEAGIVNRSPKWVSNCGLEWLYRMVLEPKRLVKRYLVDDLPFFLLITKQRFGVYKNPFGNCDEK